MSHFTLLLAVLLLAASAQAQTPDCGWWSSGVGSEWRKPTPFTRCRMQAPFFVELAPENKPLPPKPKSGEVLEIPPPGTELLYKTQLPNAAGTVEVCAVRGTSTVSVYTGVDIVLEDNDTVERVPLNSCAVFTARRIRMSKRSGTALSRARVCLIETVALNEPIFEN